MEYNILICDTQKEHVTILETYIKYYKKKSCIKFNIYKTYSSNECLNVFSTNIIDIILLEVEIDNKSGFDIAKEIRNINHNVYIIFITAYLEYGYEAFRVNAFDYIIKPINIELFFNIMNKVIKSIREQKYLKSNVYDCFRIKTKKMNIKLKYGEILFFEKIGKKVRVVTNYKEFTFRSSLIKIEKQLNQDIFVKSHQGYIVNINKINNFNNFELSVGKKHFIIPVSKRNVSKVKKYINNGLQN